MLKNNSKATALFLFIFLAATVNAKKSSEYAQDTTYTPFTFVVKNAATPVKNQYKTSTCWSFSAISLIESELLRQGKGSYDLSEMYIVRHTYEQKADKYVRMHGKINFSGGGAVNDVTDVIARWGIVPEVAYSGLKVDSLKHIHSEMDKVLHDYVQAIVDSRQGFLSGVWREGYLGILDSYLGAVPEMFAYKNEMYTPEGFAKKLEINPSNYIALTSYTHHPYYQPFIIEVPDNWSWGSVYNLPLDELIQTIDQALMNGYTLVWAADVSEDGFSFKKGLAVVPEILYQPRTTDEEQDWKDLSKCERDAIIFNLDSLSEITVTPELRQKAFDNYSTTDDHGMHITGMAKTKDGRKFYYVKNSWGTSNPYLGYMFVSENYVRYKTMSVLINKNAAPAPLRKKINVK